MVVPQTQPGGWLSCIGGCAFWTLLGLFDAAQTYLSYAMRGQPMGAGRAVVFGLALWYAWAILSVAIVPFVRRFRIEQRNWAERLFMHLLAGACFAVTKLCMDYPIIELLYCPAPGLLPFPMFLSMALSSHFHTYVIIYWSMVGVIHAIDYYHGYRERERNLARLELLLSKAQLQCLRSQLHPHFLFNTLNAIAALIHRDAKLADRMIDRLGALLRRTLASADVHEVALADEMEFISAYLEIEQARFGARLKVQIAVDSQVENARVPSLILQPIVENAIRHGIGRNPRGGKLTIRASQLDESLRLMVEDSGAGTAGPLRFDEHIGLSNTRARLWQLYGDDHGFEIVQTRFGGALVIIDLPLSCESNSIASQMVPVTE